MPREIKTTIAVDGEAAFKKAINDANTSLRNMGTQLTLATAQFKKDGDAMKLVETRSKALKGEIGQQEEIVKALQKAVEDSSKAFGENSEKTEKWQAELNRAQAKLVNLQSELTLNEAGLDRNGKAFDEGSQKAADYQATLQNIGKNVSFKTVTEGIGKITDGFENAVSKVLDLGEKLWTVMAQAATWADDKLTLADIYGIDVEELQRMQYTADLIDTPVESIISAKKKLKNNIMYGNQETQNLFEMLGIDLKDENGDNLPIDDVFWDLGETLRHVEDETKRDAMAMKLFGKSFDDLNPLFKAGRKTYEETMSSWDVVSKESVESMGELDDSIQTMKNNFETLKYSMLAEIADPFKEVTNGLSNLMKEFNEWLKTEDGQKAMGDLSEALKELFSGLSDIKFGDALNIAKDALNALVEGLHWLTQNKQGVFDSLKYIAGGFGLLKVSETVIKFLMLKNGVGGLLGGGKGSGTGVSGNPNNVPTPGQGVNGAEAAAAGAGGGWLTGLWNKATAASANASSYIVSSGLASILPVVWDKFQNETNAGRALRDGTDFLEGLQKDLEERKQEIEQNAETFGENWNGTSLDGNVLARKVVQIQEDMQKWLFGGGKTAEEPYTQREPATEAGEKLLTAEEWQAMSAAEQALYMKTHPLQEIDNSFFTQGDFGRDGASLMNDAVSEMKTNTEAAKQVADKVSGADMRKFNGLPEEIRIAAQRGTAAGANGLQVIIDGQTAGRIIAPYVSEIIAQGAIG